jgi:hypothetical protein
LTAPTAWLIDLPIPPKQKPGQPFGSSISGLPEIGIKKRKQGNPGLRAQISLSHFAEYQDWKDHARIIDIE